MKNYYIADSKGNITQTGTCQIENYDSINLGSEDTLFEGTANPFMQCVIDGSLYDYTSSELTEKNNLPPGWIWQMPERIAVDARALTDAKVQAWERIKQSRTAAELVPFTCDGAVYDSNKEQIMGAVQLATLAQMTSQPFSIDWTLKDNSSKTLNVSQMIAVGIALGQKISSIYDTGRLLRIQIDAATTNEELDAMVWSS